MYSKSRIKKLIDTVNDDGLKSGLTDAQVTFVKTTIIGLTTRIVTLETKANQAAVKFTNIEARLKSLESK